MLRAVITWGVVAAAILVPLGLAASSPLLAYRDPVYIAAGLAGVLGLCLLLIQPLLAGGLLPGPDRRTTRRAHRTVGAALLALIVLHVAALWRTSPPDVIDALTFTSPTPFSIWGVLAMWAAFAAGAFAFLRHRLRPRVWRIAHKALAATVVIGTVLHALLIEGTMEWSSKLALCVLVVGAAGFGLWVRR